MTTQNKLRFWLFNPGVHFIKLNCHFWHFKYHFLAFKMLLLGYFKRRLFWHRIGELRDGQAGPCKLLCMLVFSCMLCCMEMWEKEGRGRGLCGGGVVGQHGIGLAPLPPPTNHTSQPPSPTTHHTKQPTFTTNNNN